MAENQRPYRRVILRGEAIESLPTLYDELAGALALPRYFGRNLDALRDVLAGDVEGPIELVWSGSARSQAALGDAFDRVLAVFRAVEAEREDFRLVLA